MPIYALQCLEGHTADLFAHHPRDLGAETRICACGHSLAPVFSVGRGLTWFEEGRPRVIHNLGHEPVVIRSHAEHQAAMKAAGVTWATRGRGHKGQWI